MLTFPANVKLYLANQPVDGRKSFNGLTALVESEFGVPTMGGDIFVFLNKRNNLVRLLFWDRDGFCLVAKRLVEGTFKRIKEDVNGSSRVEIDPIDLSMLLEGVEATNLRKHKRYLRKNNSSPS